MWRCSVLLVLALSPDLRAADKPEPLRVEAAAALKRTYEERLNQPFLRDPDEPEKKTALPPWEAPPKKLQAGKPDAGWDKLIHPLLVKHNVSAVFHGHDHFFAKQELDNVLYLMVPQPGHPGFDRLRNAGEYGYIRGAFLPPSGHVRVTLSSDKATVEYVRAYLPKDETDRRKNRDVAHSHTIRAPRP